MRERLINILLGLPKKRFEEMYILSFLKSTESPEALQVWEMFCEVADRRYSEEESDALYNAAFEQAVSIKEIRSRVI